MKKWIFTAMVICIEMLQVSAQDHKALFAELDTWMASGRFLDTYKKLEATDPQNKDLDIFLIKLNLALNFHVVQLQYQKFGFVNLQEHQTLQSARKNSGKYDLYSLDALPIIDSFIQTQADNGLLYKVKSDYLYEVFLDPSENFSLSRDSLAHLLEITSQKAIEANSADYETYFINGYFAIGESQYEKAQRMLKQSIFMNHSYAPAYYNLAYVEYILKNFNSSIIHALEARKLFKEEVQKVDVDRLLSYTYDIQGNTDSALFYLDQALSIAPDNGDALLDYLYIAIREDFPQQQKLISKIILLNPESPEAYNAVIQAYHSQNKNYAPFTDVLVELSEKYSDNDAVVGNVSFYQGQILFETSPEKAKEKFREAESYLEKIYPPDHQVFKVIQMYLNASDN